MWKYLNETNVNCYILGEGQSYFFRSSFQYTSSYSRICIYRPGHDKFLYLSKDLRHKEDLQTQYKFM